MKKLQSIQRNLEALLARDTNLKESAQRAFVAYVKSVFLMKDKEIFNVINFDTDAFARSLGLAISPRIRFLQKHKNKQAATTTSSSSCCSSSSAAASQNEDEQLDQKLMEKLDAQSNNEDNDDNEETDTSLAEEPEERIPPPPKPKEANRPDARKVTFSFYDDNEENEDDFLYLKRKNHELDIEPLKPEEEVQNRSKKKSKPVSRAALAKKMLKKNLLPNKKTVFDEEGDVVLNQGKEYISDIAREYAKSKESGIHIETAQKVLQEEDKHDKELFRQKVKRKHKEERRKQKEDRRKSKDEEEENIDEEEDDYMPDLSWLPDIDEIKKRNEEEPNDEDDDDDDDSEEENSESEPESSTSIEKNEKQQGKRNRKSATEKINRKSKRKKVTCRQDEEDYLDTGLSLADDEMIALQMMNAYS